ncbi:nuclear transcription factor Y subunit C-4 isoform X2 [Elaeis guineensis]
MEQPTQPSQPVMGGVPSAAQSAYTSPYQSAAMVTGAPAVIGAMPPGIQLASTFPTNPHQLAYQIQQKHQQLQAFWATQMANIEQSTDFKNHSLPLSRIKKVMKADADVKMISAEVPVIFAKACEMFVLELTLRSWNHAEENRRRTLQKNDIAAAVAETDIFDFLVDIIPRAESKEEGSRIASAALPAISAQANSMPYYYVPPQDLVTGAEMIMGEPGDQSSTGAM